MRSWKRTRNEWNGIRNKETRVNGRKLRLLCPITLYKSWHIFPVPYDGEKMPKEEKLQLPECYCPQTGERVPPSYVRWALARMARNERKRRRRDMFVSVGVRICNDFPYCFCSSHLSQFRFVLITKFFDTKTLVHEVQE